MSFLDDWAGNIKQFGGALASKVGLTVDVARASIPGVARSQNAALFGDEFAGGFERRVAKPASRLLDLTLEGAGAPLNFVDYKLSTFGQAARVARRRSYRDYIQGGSQAGFFESSMNEWRYFFDGDTWDRASDLAVNISAGQTLTDLGEIMAGSPVREAALARTEKATRQHRKSDLSYNIVSGTADFAKTFYLDPLNVVGKSLGLARRSFVKSPIAAGTDISKAVETGRTGNRVQSLIDKTKGWDAHQFYVGVEGLQQSTHGMALASAMAKANRIEDVAEREQQLKLVQRVMYGDQAAKAELGKVNAEIMDQIAGVQKQTNDLIEANKWEDLGNGRSRYWDKPELQDVYAERMKNIKDQETKLVSETERLEGLSTIFGSVRDRTLHVTAGGASRARRRGVSEFGTAARELQGPLFPKTTLRNSLWNVPVKIVAAPVTLTRAGVRGAMNMADAMATMAPHGYVHLHDPGSAKTLDAMLRTQKDFPDELRSEFVSKFIEANNEGAKTAVINAAETALFGHIAKKYGMDKKAAATLVNKYQLERASWKSRAKLYAGTGSAQAYSSAPEAGGRPGLTADSYIDEDGVVNRVPLLSTHLRDSVPVLNGNLVEHVMKRNVNRYQAMAGWADRAENALGRTTATALRRADSTRFGLQELRNDALSGFNRLWKFSVLFRLGYPIRNITDEQLRIWAKLDSGITQLYLDAFGVNAKNVGKRATFAQTRHAKDMHRLDVERMKTLDDSIELTEGRKNRLPAIRKQLQEIEKRYAATLPDSKVRNDDGSLKRVYHGTPGNFETFDDAMASEHGWYGQGHYFTSDPQYAAGYTHATAEGADATPNIRMAYLDIKNPFDWNDTAGIPKADVEAIFRHFRKPLPWSPQLERRGLAKESYSAEQLQNMLDVAGEGVSRADALARATTDYERKLARWNEDYETLTRVGGDTKLLGPKPKKPNPREYEPIPVPEFNRFMREYLEGRGFDGSKHKEFINGGAADDFFVTDEAGELTGAEAFLVFRADQIHMPYQTDKGETLIGRADRLKASERQLAEEVGQLESLVAESDTLRTRLERVRKEGRNKVYRLPRERVGEQGFILPDGTRLEGAFGGPDAELRRWQASGIGREQRLIFQGENDSYARAANAADWRDVEPGEPGHLEVWLNAMNKQIRQDPIARMILEGQSDRQIAQWLKATPEGKALARRMPFHASNRDDWIANIRSHVDSYVPTSELQETLLSRNLNGDDLADLLREGKAPRVNGPSLEHSLGNGPVSNLLNRVMETSMKYLAEIPGDRLARHPMYAALYQQRAMQEAEHLLADPGRLVSGKRVDAFDAEDLEHIRQISHAHALKEMKGTLYDISAHSNAAQMMRFMSPFMGAWQETLTRWWNLAKDKPELINYFQLAWQMPNKLGMVVDRDGNPVDRSKGITDDEFIVLALPPGLTGGNRKPLKMFDSVPYVPKSAFNLALQGDPWWLPGFGPLVQIPVGWAQTQVPDLNNVAEKFVNPFGPPKDVLDAISPATVRRFRSWQQGEAAVDFGQDAGRIYRQMYTDWEKGGREGEEPDWDEAVRRTKALYQLKVANNFLNPFPATFRSPYQFYIDSYNILREQAATEGRNQEWIDDTFLEKYGETYFLMVQSTSKNNANADYTADWVKAYKQRKDVVADYPEFAAQIVGDHPGEYNASARAFLQNERYKPGSSETILESKDPRTAFEDNQAKLGWIQYKKLTDLLDAAAHEAGLESYRDNAGLMQAKRDYVEKLSASNTVWADRYTRLTTAENFDTDIQKLEQLSQDERLTRDPMNTGIKSLQNYLYLRRTFQEILSEQESNSPTAKANEPIMKLYTRYVNQIVESDTMFSRDWFSGKLEFDPMLVDTTGGE